jgi:hypothetical protein
MADARIAVAIAGEDHAHRVLAMRLLDCVLVARGASLGWPDKEELDQARRWVGSEKELECLYTTTTLYADLQKAAGRPFQLHRIGDEPAGKAGWFVALYQLFALKSPAPALLIGLSDAQTDETLLLESKRAARYLRTTLKATMNVVFGVPLWDTECWFVAALTSAPNHQKAQKELGFDPLGEPHRLTAQPNDSLKDAKRVLRFLIDKGGKSLKETKTGALSCEEYEELAEAWSELERLKVFDRCGLKDFLMELQAAATVIIPGAPDSS